ncbi:MAG: single-stranded DNA-binding protein [Chthoniobacterales bacterium]|nr:single-stranded DNA-binding protein [Chthoniobacterales bacterium]
MANLNKVQLIGNITRDPEVKYTPKGSAVTDLGLAINRFYTTETGEKREEVTFVDVTLWGRQAEIAGEYCKKGRSIYVEGRLQLDSWEDKTTGQKRNKLRVVGDSMQLLGPKPGGAAGSSGSDEEGGSAGYSRPASHAPSGKFTGTRGAAPAAAAPHPEEEDDIPF